MANPERGIIVCPKCGMEVATFLIDTDLEPKLLEKVKCNTVHELIAKYAEAEAFARQAFLDYIRVQAELDKLQRVPDESI
jgi:hypothetical protein